MSYNVSFIYRIIDKYSRPLQRIADQTKGFKRAVGNVGKGLGKGFGGAMRSLDGLGKKLRGIPSLANSAGAALLTMAGMVPVNRAIAFEEAVTNLDKAFEFGNLNQRSELITTLKKLGPELGRTGTEMANLAFEAGKLGIVQNEVTDFVALAAKASEAFDGLPIEDAGQLIGDLKNKFGLAVDGTGELLDAINKLADNTTVNGGQIINVVSRVSGLFSTLGVPPEAAAGMAAFARQIEVSDELAASGLKQFAQRLIAMGRGAELSANPIGTMKDELARLAQISGDKRLTVIQDAYGLEASKFIAGAVDKMNLLGDTMNIVGEKSNFLGSMSDEFGRKQETAGFKVKQMRAKLDQLIVTLGERLLPVVVRATEAVIPLVDKAIQFVDQNPGMVKMAAGFGLVVAAAIPLSFVAGSLLSIVSLIGSIGTLFTGTIAVLGGLWSAITGGIALVGTLVAAIVAAPVAFGVAFVAAGAALWYFWDDVKAFGSWIKDTLAGIIDKVWSKLEGLGGAISGALEFFGITGDTPTITDQPAGAAASPATQQAVNNNRASLSGSIGVTVDGPGKVTEASIQSDPPGSLGMNVAGALGR